MKWIICVLALIWPVAGLADEWQRVVNDEGVTEALAGRTLQYDPLTMQHFGKLGDTQYITERAADGRWAARGGQYCSVWPPSDTWACYDLYLNGDQVRFVGADRSVSEGTYRE